MLIVNCIRLSTVIAVEFAFIIIAAISSTGTHFGVFIASVAILNDRTKHH